MTNAERKARALIAARKTSDLVADFELTDKLEMSVEVAMTRGWLMDELEKRDSVAFEAWVDSDDESPREYFLSLNSICANCAKLNNGCNGTTCKVYTGCVWREVKA